MSKRVIDFPYPVLRSDSINASSFKKDKYFKIAIDDFSEKEGNYVFPISFDTNSELLKAKFTEKSISLYLLYETKSIREVTRVEDIEEIKEIIISPSILQSTDIITFKAQMISECDFEFNYAEEMEEAYNIDFPYYISKKDVVAISNEVSFNFNRSGKSFIKISKTDSINEGFYIDLSQDEFIIICFNENLMNYYNDLKAKEYSTDFPLMTLLHSNLIYMALVSLVMDFIHNGVDNHKNKRWFKILDSILSNKGINLEDKVEELQDSDLKDIYLLVNLFLNNYYEKAMKRCGEV